MRHIKFIAFVGLIALQGLLIGCSPSKIDSSSANAPIIGGGTAGSISVTLTDVTTGATVASIASSGSVNVNATVRDSSNNVISGATVSFAVSNASAGSLAAMTATTNALGVATVQFNANAVDMLVTITVSVTTGGNTVNNSATLTIGTPAPPVPQNLTITITPLTVNIQGTADVTVTLTDSGGNASYGTPVTLDIVTGSTATGSFSPTSIVSSLPLTTDSNGQVSAIFYAGGASGSINIRATVASPLIVKSSSLSITSTPSSVSLTISPNSLNTSATALISASVVNLLGQPVPDGTQVTFSCVAGACSPANGTFPSVASTVSGTASITFTASASVTGGASIQACAGASVCNTAQITVTASATSSIEYVSATPQVIGIQSSGQPDTSTVTFKVTDSNGVGKPNVLVDFTLFGPTGAYIGSIVGSTTDSGSTGADGTVTAFLHSGLVAGPVRIVATVNGSSPAIATSSGSISIGGGVPSDVHFSVAVSKFNLEGFAFDNIQSTLTAYLADRFGNYNVLAGTSVSFATDAGAIDTSSATDATGVASSTYRTQDPRPIDVAPLAGEPFYTFGGHTYNPRDGWITVLVTTTGEETFVDANANGAYDVGETFTDIGEPFIDSNDNGVRDAGEQFFDWPSYVTGGTVGTYETGNGVWDSKIPIWRTVNLVYTGPPDFTTVADFASGKRTSRIELSGGGQGNVTIPNGSSQLFTISVSDINMNTLIGGTTIAALLPAGSAGTLIGGSSFTVADQLSFGPTIVTVAISNTIADLTDKPAFLECDVTWKGNKYTFLYPGTITLSHP